MPRADPAIAPLSLTYIRHNSESKVVAASAARAWWPLARMERDFKSEVALFLLSGSFAFSSFLVSFGLLLLFLASCSLLLLLFLASCSLLLHTTVESE